MTAKQLQGARSMCVRYGNHIICVNKRGSLFNIQWTVAVLLICSLFAVNCLESILYTPNNEEIEQHEEFNEVAW